VDRYKRVKNQLKYIFNHAYSLITVSFVRVRLSNDANVLNLALENWSLYILFT
jgi:hypothetical protein